MNFLNPKVAIVWLVSGASLLCTNPTRAVDGSINFEGEVVSESCRVNIQNPNFTVSLPAVSITALANVGDTAGRTPFTISLSDCATDRQVAVYFEPGVTVDFASGRLINTAVSSPANNVQIQLRDANNVALPVKGIAGPDDAQPTRWANPSADGVHLNYYAEYFAAGDVTPGAVMSNVQYTIIYN